VKAKLNNIAEIRNGYQFRGSVKPVKAKSAGDDTSRMRPGVVRVIQIKDVDNDRRLQTDDLVAVHFDGDTEKYQAREGDVLFLSRGHRLFATAITEPLQATVVTGYFYILRLKTDRVQPGYLAWYINQPPFQTVLRTFMKGTQQPLVSRKDIEDLEVEIPSLSVQEAIVALDDLRVVDRQLSAVLLEKRSLLIQTISMQAALRHA
jgi:hypothetical protein